MLQRSGFLTKPALLPSHNNLGGDRELKQTHREWHGRTANYYGVLVDFIENGPEIFSLKYEVPGLDAFFKTKNLEKHLKRNVPGGNNPQLDYLKYLMTENKKIAAGIKPDTVLNPFDYDMQRLRDLPAPRQPALDLKIRNLAYIITEKAKTQPDLLDRYDDPARVKIKSLEHA